MINFDLLKIVSETAGAPGFENRIREVVISEIKDFVDELSIDNLGNVIAIKKGATNKKLMAAAHMDEIGFIVSHIDDDGFLRFHPLGGYDPKTLTAQRVIVHGVEDIVGVMGSKPIHLMSPEERTKGVKISDFFIDLGLPKEEVEKVISIGDAVTRERELIKIGNCINGKSLDNRASVYALIETLKQLKDVPLDVDFYAVFTTQEEVGLRGAHGATYAIQPNYAFAIDTTIAYDVPGSTPHERVTSLGAGAGIKVMDSSVIADQRMVSYMKTVANENEIPWQPELLPAGGTDTSVLQKMVKGGSIAGAVSIPTRHIHQVIEMVHEDDLNAVIDLTVAIVKNITSLQTNW
jgi:tetrahedral aminopeptidase